MSVLIKNQKKQYTVEYDGDHPGEKMLLIATVRHDDECGNGHNSFSITGSLYSSKRPNSRKGVKPSPSTGKARGWTSGGCIHEEIEKHVPALRPFLKWHLMDTDSPMHYKANALFWAGQCDKYASEPGEKYPANWEHFASTVILGAVGSDPASVSAPTFPAGKPLDKMTAEELGKWLDDRLPALMAEFRKAVESLGLVY